MYMWCVQVSLGPVGKNIGAGMTGGLAYLYDDGQATTPLDKLINHEIVKVQRIKSPAGEV
jgi:glutamate synthase (ferredoxin)